MVRSEKTVASLGEFGFIDRVRKYLDADVPRSVIKGIGDDTAVCRYYGNLYLLFTTDMLIEGVHFTKRMGAQAVGHKALACNISDIAAMGGTPQHAVISLGLPKASSLAWASGIYRGIRKLARKFGVSIVGGDTVRSNKAVINIALTGVVQKDHLVLRSGARKGDQIFVTGHLGNSLRSGKHLRFTPRVREARYLVRAATPSAMIDISDGLASDLGHILEQSKAGARLWAERIPCAKGASLNNALYDGEDFELLFTLKAGEAGKFMRKKHPFRFIHIGEITRHKGKLVLAAGDGKEKRIPLKGYTHF